MKIGYEKFLRLSSAKNRKPSILKEKALFFVFLRTNKIPSPWYDILIYFCKLIIKEYKIMLKSYQALGTKRVLSLQQNTNKLQWPEPNKTWTCSTVPHLNFCIFLMFFKIRFDRTEYLIFPNSNLHHIAFFINKKWPY